VIHNEYFIKPTFKYIEYDAADSERKADCGIYYKCLKQVICVNEIKQDDVDLNECIRQNADQLRAYCLCNNLKIGRGISTSGSCWVFTQYDKDGEKLIMSKLFRIAVLNDVIIQFSENFLDFFETLISFLKESFDLIFKKE
jgi:hypothetical protein